ncbi:MAG: aminotransferase class V-fold PLP-dependent enzyme [Planctomycetota bacterium]
MPTRDPLPPWPPEWPEIGNAIQATVQSGDWGRYQGPAIDSLTQHLIELTQLEHCRLVSSGSLGVELALKAAAVKPNDRVVVCGYDYPGNIRAVEALGARPLLIDADENGNSLSAVELERLAATRLERVSAVVVSHLYGVPAAVESHHQICKQQGWCLVEDACQTPGARIADRPAGAWGDVAVFSFGGSKPLTAGCGGAVVSGEGRIASRLTAWLDRPSHAAPVSELQAAALLPQLQRLPRCNEIRNQTLAEILRRVSWVRESLCGPPPSITCYKLAVLSEHRDRLLEALRKRGIPAGPGYRSMHRSRRCDKFGDLTRSQQLGEQVVVIDHRALLAESDAREWLIETLEQVRVV